MKEHMLQDKFSTIYKYKKQQKRYVTILGDIEGNRMDME